MQGGVRTLWIKNGKPASGAAVESTCIEFRVWVGELFQRVLASTALVIPLTQVRTVSWLYTCTATNRSYWSCQVLKSVEITRMTGLVPCQLQLF